MRFCFRSVVDPPPHVRSKFCNVGGIWGPVCRVCGCGVNVLVGTGKADEFILTLDRVIVLNV